MVMQIEPGADREPVRKSATTLWKRSLFSPSNSEICLWRTKVTPMRRSNGLLALACMVSLSAVSCSTTGTLSVPVGKPTRPLPATAATAVPPDPFPAARAAGAAAVCGDHSWSFSQSRNGTCLQHGGVLWWTGNLGVAGPGAP